MRPVDCEQLSPMNAQDAITALRKAGYIRLSVDMRGALIVCVHPARPHEMLIIGDAAAETLASLCTADPRNPYLPLIHEHGVLRGSARPLTILIMERLYTPLELSRERFATLTGAARAIALLPTGEPHHGCAHAHMLKNAHLRSAVQAFARAVADSIDRPGKTILAYENGMNPRHAPDEQVSQNILFRKEGESAWRPVFAEPLRLRTVHDETRRAELRADAAAMIARVTPAP